MSKSIKVRFTYGGEQSDDFKSVSSVHKGPIKLSNLYDTITNPTYQQISFNEPQNPQNLQIAQSLAEVYNVPLAQFIAKSAQNLQGDPSIHLQGDPSIHLQSRNDKTDTAGYQVGSDKSLTPELKINSREALQPIEEKGYSKRAEIFKKLQTQQSFKPELKVQELKQEDFIRQSYPPVPDKKQTLRNTQKEAEKSIWNPDQIVLKSPSFKYNPESVGDRGVFKKQYVRAQKAEKYLYSGIPQKKQNDFIGCFGCCSPQPKTYTISNNSP